MQSANPHQPFPYPSLQDASKQIRTLRINLDTDDDELNCSLEIMDFTIEDEHSQGPEFSAISYTWAGQQCTEKIHVNGVAVKITRNCWNALWQIHYQAPHGVRECSAPVWIDSVCINQYDLTENG